MIRANATNTDDNFNSLAPCGANPSFSPKQGAWERFQLTRPVWGEPNVVALLLVPALISTHSPRVGRTDKCLDNAEFIEISTHSPRVGRTELAWQRSEQSAHFNSLAPCGANPAPLAVYNVKL